MVDIFAAIAIAVGFWLLCTFSCYLIYDPDDSQDENG